MVKESISLEKYILLEEVKASVDLKLVEIINPSDWGMVHEGNLRYFLKNCTGNPWTSHLAILMIARASYRRNDPQTIRNCLVTFNNRLALLFSAFDLNSMDKWDPDIHLHEYLTKMVLKEHSENQRFEFWKTYNSSVSSIKNWLSVRFDTIDQERLSPFIFPKCNNAESISNQANVNNQARKKRKGETEAIVPHYPLIRAEAHFRWNRIHRMKTKFDELVSTITNETELPIEYNYDDEYLKERFYFRIWDRPSFVLKNKDKYDSSTVSRARRLFGTFAVKEYFLEFVRAEGQQNTPTEGPWFTELISMGVLNYLPHSGTEESKNRKKAFLNSWGYGNLNPDSIPTPFNTGLKGLLSQGDFITCNQKSAEGVLLNVNTLYAGATFGLAIVDLITTTGLRLSELLQISFTKDCIVVLQLEEKQIDNKRYVLRVVPKGRTEKEDYFIGKETLNNLLKVSNLLKEHYCSNDIPKIKYRGKRAHQFPGVKPYVFQYNQRHLGDDAVTGCMRFLLHGMVFKTMEGENVVLKTHLLRHAFATHAVQVEKIPIDIVGQWMHHKNLDVTEYYSSPTSTQIAQSADGWLQSISTHIDVKSAVKRSPEEIQKMYDEAKNKVGTLNRVIGGVCSSHSFCPSKFQCIGCAAKVPEPEQKNEILKMKEWAQKSGKDWRDMGLIPEANRMLQVIRDCDIELHEINLIESFRKDESYVPEVRFTDTE